MTKSEFNKFLIYLKEDYFNKGDILNYSNGEVKIIKTFRKTWWRKLLLIFGFKINVNNSERVIYKVKTII